MKARVGTDLNEAARLLREGAVVAVPTETVYGLAANAFDPDAVLQVFAIKERPSFDPLIVHVGGRNDLAGVARELPPGAEALMDACWPGPLTLVLPRRPEVPDVVTSGLDTVAVRMPAHPMLRELLGRLPFPLAAPSANPFGYVSPTTAQHVADQLGGRVPYIVDGGACMVGVESTILGYEHGQWLLYRPGGVAVEAIARVLGGEPGVPAQEPIQMPAPGMLASHYAPGKPLLLGDLDDLLAEHAGTRVAVIAFRKDRAPVPTRVLSAAGDLAEAARNLFSALRELDRSDAELILAEPVPDLGLGRAINDRLRRASARRPS